MRTYDEINEKIKSGKAVVVTAEEIISIVDEKGIDKAYEEVDVVTTATFGPMCSSGAFLNFGHGSPKIRMEEITLNNVPCNGGLAAVDTFIGATEASKDNMYYGGAHVISELIKGNDVELHATGKGTDCYPRKEIKTKINLDSINEAYMYNPRNCYQNYSAAINTTDSDIFTYMGRLQANMKNINYSTAGELSPLLNDPTYETIGIGTKIFIGGSVGYVSWYGTQFNSGVERGKNDIPLTPSGTLALIGNLKNMDPKYISPAVFKNYGISLNVGVGIPIPILSKEILKKTAIKNEEILTNVVDYSGNTGGTNVVKQVNYSELRSGSITINNKKIKTAPTTSLKKSREIAELLKNEISSGNFTLQKPIEKFDLDVKFTSNLKDDKNEN